MLEASIPGFRTGTVKDAIIGILANKFPLQPKEIYSKVKQNFNKQVTYQAVYKSLQELLQNSIIEKNNSGLYLLHNKWILELEKFSLFLKDAYHDNLLRDQKNKKSQLARIRFYSSPDDFYRILTNLVVKEKEMRLSAKTPAIILSKESKLTKYRKVYVNNLLHRIRDGSLKIKYLFATEPTKQKIIEEKDIGALERLREYENYPNLSLRHAPLHSVIASAIGSKDFLFGMASPFTKDLVGIIHLSSFNTKSICQIYDQIFSNALEPYEIIEDIKKQL